MTETNYGLLLQKEDTPGSETYTTIGAVVDLGIPEILTDAVETTSHSSAGWRSRIPSGLKGLEGFDVSLDFSVAVLAAIYADILAKTVAEYRIVFAATLLAIWRFDAFPTSIKPDASNAQSPDHLKFVVKFVPTGAISFDESEAEGEWYDNLEALYTDCGGALAITSTEEHQLKVYAIIGGGAPVEVQAAQFADLTFASTVEADATVDEFGLIEGVSSGETVISVALTSNPDINTSVVVTLAS